MEVASQSFWQQELVNPAGKRQSKPRTSGITMVIDKGLGTRAFADLLETAEAHIDLIKLGFGTAALYPEDVLAGKIRLAAQTGVAIMPGGTFLEAAVAEGIGERFLEQIALLGFTAVEVSDGTIQLDRTLRTGLIREGCRLGLTVYTEYGKKCWGSRIETDELIETVLSDLEAGAELVTVEARESGVGVGIFDESGKCRDEEVQAVLEGIPSPHLLLWEAPQKSQQVRLMELLGPDVNLGNIAPQDVISLEALRRGLRSDSFFLRGK
ncbi:phosphosulfolactate synthase [Paenibacillus sp. YN15]|uniref:phosphosulfolactate synthase n=1 Tax=Paenibacillus sp. YN15 TaxID=1742774 RepID=UPI000DCB4D8C|nr:phosphosulfolactate synthase [Paenibacillus sp. YN15]RAV00984.1 phosphosulfolactate synthase [Paenibacillus sp. YN15]